MEEKKMRFFIAAVRWQQGSASGYSDVLVRASTYLNKHKMVKDLTTDIHQMTGDTKTTVNVIVLNIIELSEEDYNDYQK